MDVPFDVGRTPVGDRLAASLKAHTLIVGATGSGKSCALRSFILSAARTMGASVQFICFDIKRVSMLGLEKRCHVYINPDDFTMVLDSVETAMYSRYRRMVEDGVDGLDATAAHPRICVVVDELPAFMGSQRTKERSAELRRLIENLSNQGRQANVTLVLCGQSVSSDVIPTSVRSNCSQRFVLKLNGVEQLGMACDGRVEECRSNLLNLPGEAFGLTTQTNGNWVRFRFPKMDRDREAKEFGMLAGDKSDLPFLRFE